MSRLTRVRAATEELREATSRLRFRKPVTHVYNPLDYAHRTHLRYLRKFGDHRIRVLFLGMNPGPFGMAQTGVPFGEVASVRDFLGIQGRVDRPDREHPKRPVDGFACTRREVSGARLWGAIAEHWQTPENFFASHFIANYCPLVFMEESGRNRTPDQLPARERKPLFEICDRHLGQLVEAWEPEWVVGVGAFATRRATEALDTDSIRIGTVLHPSPANPRANRDWAGEASRQLSELGLCGGPRGKGR